MRKNPSAFSDKMQITIDWLDAAEAAAVSAIFKRHGCKVQRLAMGRNSSRMKIVVSYKTRDAMPGEPFARAWAEWRAWMGENPSSMYATMHRNPGHVWRLTFDNRVTEDWPGNTAEQAIAAARSYWRECCGEAPGVISVANVTRNPSSGAKQRARGTRTETFDQSGMFSFGGRHAQGLRTAASIRKSAKSMPHFKKDHLAAMQHTSWQRPTLPNPRGYSPSLVASMRATGRQDADNVYEIGHEDQTIGQLHDYMLDRLQEEGDYPELSRAELSEAATAWAQAWLSRAKQIAAQYAEREMHENPSSGAKQRARGIRKANWPQQGSQSKGAEWDRQMRSAARLRLETFAQAPSSAKRWHAQTLAKAAGVRPALPNPAPSFPRGSDLATAVARNKQYHLARAQLSAAHDARVQAAGRIADWDAHRAELQRISEEHNAASRALDRAWTRAGGVISKQRGRW